MSSLLFTQRAGHGAYKPYELHCTECGEDSQLSADKVIRIVKKKGGDEEVKIKARCPNCGDYVKNDKDIERGKVSKNPKPPPATKTIGKDVNGDDVQIVDGVPEVPPEDLGRTLRKEKFLKKARKENPDMSEEELEELYEQDRQEKTLDEA